MEDRELDAGKIVRILDHPARKRIIELLGSHGAMPWKQLASELGMGTGALYYHLDTLEGIVARDPTKKYTLTKPGQAVYAYVRENPIPDSIRKATLTLAPSLGRERYLEGFFAPRGLLYRMTSSNAKALATLILSSLVFVSALAYLGTATELFYITKASGVFGIAVSHAFSIAAVFLIGYLATRVVFHERASPLVLAATAAFAFLPVVTFSVLLRAIGPLVGFVPSGIPTTLVFAFFQAWSATIFGAGVSVASGVRFEKSLLVSLILLYASMILIFLQGNLL